ncbi:MAG: matrixin family metalloprotease [Methylococcales bacterium]|nr:matrixin family metalloprotease [Methylococcales bacterium]
MNRGWLSILLMFSATAPAFELMGPRWPEAELTFQFDLVNIRGQSRAASGQRWNDAFIEAMMRWNRASAFTFNAATGRGFDPCRRDDINTAGFRRDDCGFGFGRNTLAITSNVFIRNVYQESDIVFNDNEPWDVFDSRLSGEVVDFTRVAAHELGHTLGLDHETRRPALMQPIVSNTTLPLADDLNGVAALYGAAPQPQSDSCQQSIELALNVWQTGRLEAEDCRRFDLDIGQSQDESAVDQYRFTLPTGGRVVIQMQGLALEPLDAFLELRDDARQVLSSDDDSGAGLDAMMVADLAAGDYFLWANTALASLETGEYRVQVAIGGIDQAASVRLLPGNEVQIDSVEFSGQRYSVRLHPFNHPDFPDTLFWTLGEVRGGAPVVPGATVLPESNHIILHPVDVNGQLIDVGLRWSPDANFPELWLWRLNSAEFR